MLIALCYLNRIMSFKAQFINPESFYISAQDLNKSPPYYLVLKLRKLYEENQIMQFPKAQNENAINNCF